jgi:hypothetical protein
MDSFAIMGKAEEVFDLLKLKGKQEEARKALEREIAKKPKPIIFCGLSLGVLTCGKPIGSCGSCPEFYKARALVAKALGMEEANEEMKISIEITDRGLGSGGNQRRMTLLDN